MIYSKQIIVKRWLPILKEYEKCKLKVTPRSFKYELVLLFKPYYLDKTPSPATFGQD